jgi:16S rRNA (guanine527-N7)-methyltransferase
MDFEKRLSVILDLGFDQSALPRLQAYIDLLWASNEELNLLSRKMSFDDLVDNHLIDCLMPLKHFPKNKKVVADFGTGGGLPGVLYAIIFPDIKFQLFEKSPKKQEFLGLCKKIASNIEIFGEIPLDLPSTDLVIARAFKPLDVMLDMSRNYYLNGGHYFLFKGRLEKINEEILLAKKKFPDVEITVTPLVSPTLEVERHLVLMSKTVS